MTALTEDGLDVLYRQARSLQLVMHEAAARSLRTAERFLLAPPLAGHFGSSTISVCDISAKGARFVHGQPLEMGKKSVLRLPIEEFSAKVRLGPPIDDEEDYSFPAWAGVVPLEMVAGEPINDPRLDPSREPPPYASHYKRGNSRP